VRMAGDDATVDMRATQYVARCQERAEYSDVRCVAGAQHVITAFKAISDDNPTALKAALDTGMVDTTATLRRWNVPEPPGLSDTASNLYKGDRFDFGEIKEAVWNASCVGSNVDVNAKNGHTLKEIIHACNAVHCAALDDL